MLNPHPGLPEFEYVRPLSVAEASQFLAQHAGVSRPLLGGTDTFVRMRDGVWTDRYLVDVKQLDGASELSYDSKKGLTVGAAVPMNRVIASPDVKKHFPLLAEACRTVASYQLRSRATIVGNVCNASPAGDSIGTCLVLEGVLHVHGQNGEREEPLSNFFKGPGKTNLKAGDVVTAITFPPAPKGSAGRYIKLGRNALGDLALVGVTVLGYPDVTTGSGYRFRICLASVAPTPIRAPWSEAILVDNDLNEDTIGEAAVAAMDACNPIDDVRGSARYRKYMIRNLTRQAVTDVWNRIKS